MSNSKTYDGYKTTGLDWCKQLPTHWKVKKLKYLASLVTTKATLKTNPIALENISNWTGDFIETDSTFEGDGIEFQPGDILFGKLRPYLAKAYLANNSGQAIGDFHVLRPNLVHNEFLQRLLLSREVISILDGSTYGAKMPRVAWEFLANLKTPVPSQQEQIQIATFLDRETAKIDRLIGKQQRLIKLLEEKRQAVISHAVTKGLNPDAPMKNSGIEWLGKVPEHWTLRRLKHISPKIGVGLVINPSTYTRDEGLHFIFGGNVEPYGFKLENSRKISEEDSIKLHQSRLETNDIVTVRVGAPGVTAVVDQSLNGSNCASVMIVRRGDFNSDWLCACINSPAGMAQVKRVEYGAAQKQFNISDAIEFVFPTPPKHEQDEISKYVGVMLNKFDKLMATASKQIQLLKERRSTLISAAVTGKIDVRDQVPHDV